MASTCPRCHRSATWSAKWQTCSACDEPISIQRAISQKSDKPVVFHVAHNEVSLSRRKDGICPRCALEAKTYTGYCRACTNLRARERRMLTTSGRPPGRPRKLTNG